MLPFTQRISKALIACTLVVLGTVYASFGAEKETPVGIVLASRLNLRGGPGFTHPSFGILESGTRVVILGEKGGWLKVLHGQTTGYVRYLAEYIRILSDDPKTDPGKARIRLLEERASHIEHDIEMHQGKASNLSDRESEVLDTLNETEHALNRMDQHRIRIQSQMDGLQKKIEALEKHSSELIGQVKIIRHQAVKRLTALYKLSQIGGFHFLVSARSVHEYLYLEEGFRRILAQDEAMLSVLSEKSRALNRTLEDLKKNRQEKQALEQTYRLQMQNMVAEKAKREGLLEEIQSQKTLQLAAIQDLKRSADRLEDTLKALRNRVTSIEPAISETGSFSAMKGLLEMPVEGKIVRRFGVYKIPRLRMDAQRNGVEIEAGRGFPVKAVFKGKVIFSDWFRGYGNLLIIEHGEGFFTVYAHALELFKKKEERVETGEVIATVGNPGSREGPNLYFEIRQHEKPVDPLAWLKRN